MTALFMIFDYGFTFIEVFLFFIILKAIYSDINYKYAFIITLVSACCTTFINQISLFSAFSVIIFVLSTFIGGCILVRKDYFMLLSISAFYVLMMGCYEFCYASLIMHFSSYRADYLTLILDYGWPRSFLHLQEGKGYAFEGTEGPSCMCCHPAYCKRKILRLETGDCYGIRIYQYFIYDP